MADPWKSQFLIWHTSTHSWSIFRLVMLVYQRELVSFKENMDFFEYPCKRKTVYSTLPLHPGKTVCKSTLSGHLLATIIPIQPEFFGRFGGGFLHDRRHLGVINGQLSPRTNPILNHLHFPFRSSTIHTSPQKQITVIGKYMAQICLHIGWYGPSTNLHVSSCAIYLYLKLPPANRNNHQPPHFSGAQPPLPCLTHKILYTNLFLRQKPMIQQQEGCS